MQEHPVPQNVTGYEFHLIGQMTLKQFMEVAAGIILAVVINMTNLPVFVKYPLMAIAGLTGVALAFVPLEGRPLDRWFLAFIKSIYQPTMFFWKKTQTIPDVFEYKPPTNLDTSPTVDYRPLRESRVQEFLTTLPLSSTPGEPSEEDVRAQEILALFGNSFAQTPSAVAGQTRIQEGIQLPSRLPTQPIASPTGRILEIHGENAVENKPVGKTADDGKNLTEIKSAKIVPMGFTEHIGAPLPIVPITEEKKISGEFTIVNPTTPKQETANTLKPVQTLSSLPFPSKPTVPNMVVGMILSSEGKIVENAIVTISKASDNTPVRALKTNTLGQFAVVTPLEGGNYIVNVEKDGHHFDNQSLVLNNQVVEPILIQAS